MPSATTIAVIVSRTGITERVCGSTNHSTASVPATIAAHAIAAARQRPRGFHTRNVGASAAAPVCDAIVNTRWIGNAMPKPTSASTAITIAVSCGSV